MDSLEWNVLLPDVAGNEPIDDKFNIFHSMRFLSCLMDLKARAKKDETINIKEEVCKSLQYSFWSKAEYEIVVKSFILSKKEYKVDVYEQVMLNFDAFYEYLMKNWKKIPAKTYRQQRGNK